MTKHYYTKELDIPQDADSVRYLIPEGYTAKFEDGVLIIEPEENYDERIRKALIDGVRQIRCKNGITQEQMIAYLEKQKAVNEKESFTWTRHDEAVRKEAIACLEDWKDAIIRVGGLVDYENILAWLKEELPEKQKEQKSEWDDEDEQIRNEILEYFIITRSQDFVANPERQKWISYLEKQKEQKQEWSEEDKKIAATICKEGDLKPSEQRWLKSLPERFNLQLKQEWNEEDEIELNDAIKYIQNYGETSSDEYTRLRAKEIVEWLKSIRNPVKDRKMKLKILKYLSTRCSSLEYEEVEEYLNNLRPSWKPSEEQMGALNYAYCELFKRGDVDHNILGPFQNLIDTLRKL